MEPVRQDRQKVPGNPSPISFNLDGDGAANDDIELRRRVSSPGLNTNDRVVNANFVGHGCRPVGLLVLESDYGAPAAEDVRSVQIHSEPTTADVTAGGVLGKGHAIQTDIPGVHLRLSQETDSLDVEIRPIQNRQDRAFRVTVAVIIRRLIFREIHERETAIPRIEHNFDLCIIGRQNRVRIRHCVGLTVAINGHVIVADYRVTIGGGLDVKWPRPRDVKANGVSIMKAGYRLLQRGLTGKRGNVVSGGDRDDCGSARGAQKAKGGEQDQFSPSFRMFSFG